MKIQRRLAGIVLALFLVAGITPGKAGASEVDLGSPTTIEQLLDSPEYRIWHADVLRLYQAFFNRTPDTGGAAYWIDKYEDGSTLDDIAWGFSNSTEFQNQYGSSLANSEFLTIVYSNVLGRAPDQEGFDYWLGQMNGGLTQHGVVRWVVANDEFITNYPFTGTATALEDFLLSTDQVVGFSGSTYNTGLEPGPRAENSQRGCDAAYAFPKNLEAVLYEVDGNSTFTQIVYEFSTVAAAEAFMDRSRTIVAACDSTISGYESLTISDFPTTGYGDESVGVLMVGNNSSTPAQRKEIRIRVDRLILAVFVTTDLTNSAESVLDHASAAVAHANSVAG